MKMKRFYSNHLRILYKVIECVSCSLILLLLQFLQTFPHHILNVRDPVRRFKFFKKTNSFPSSPTLNSFSLRPLNPPKARRPFNWATPSREQLKRCWSFSSIWNPFGSLLTLYQSRISKICNSTKLRVPSRKLRHDYHAIYTLLFVHDFPGFLKTKNALLNCSSTISPWIRWSLG